MNTFTIDQVDQFDRDMYEIEQIQRRIEDGYYDDYEYEPIVYCDHMDMSGATIGDR